MGRQFTFNTLSANPKNGKTHPKQIADNLPTHCLSVFDHFAGLALKGLTIKSTLQG